MFESRNARLRKRTPKWLTGLLLITPAAVAIGVTILYPIGWSLELSFMSNKSITSGRMVFVGFKNYLSVLQSSQFHSALINTCGFAATTVVIELVLGMLVAVQLNKRLPGTQLFRTSYMLPMMIAPMVASLIWRWMFVGEYGILNHALAAIGIAGPEWLAQPMSAKWAVIITGLWGSLPFSILVLLAALTAISDDYIEAARIDGANNFQIFWRITIHLVKPAILQVLVIRIADSFKLYDAVKVLTDGGPANATNVITTYLYSRTFGDLRFGEGTAGSFLLTIFIALISLTTFRMMRPGSKERAAQ